MAQCVGRLTPFNLAVANASQQMLAGSLNRVAIGFCPSSIVAAFNTRALTSAVDGIAPQTGWSQILTIDLWTHGQLVMLPWFCWTTMAGIGYVIEVEYPGQLRIPGLIDQAAGGPVT